MSAILSFIGWSFLPNLITTWTLKIFYRLMTRAGDPLPPANSPRYLRAHKRVFITVVSLYLLYTIYESYHTLTQSPTFYDLLSLPPSVSPATLKSRFRRLTVLFHPDKAGVDSADHFVHLKLAYDTLSDPTKRFAYDRFGPEILEWKHCSSVYDYVLRGAQGLIPYYAATGLLLVLSVLGKFELGRWWRFLVLTGLMVGEATLVSRPYQVMPDIPFVKPLLAFEQAVLMRKVCVTCFIAFNQLGPFLVGGERKKMGEGGLEGKLEQLMVMAGVVEVEAAKAQHVEFIPFAEGDGKQEVERKMRDWLVELTVRNDPEVRDAMGNAKSRRRMGVPAGAKGTK
ncbi:chaperone J-domain-containing protein [Wilcoxina mikolae CBS 423.85]|nr:chaperone J-domain-containing protein [Wilcoxina mikolae CBS 423.85]